MADLIVCGNCGTKIKESNCTPIESRKPCPNCSSTRRNFLGEMNATISASASAVVGVLTYPYALLTIARSLIEQGHFNIAIVTSHMACEVATERAFDVAYSAKKLESLGEVVDSLMNGNNLANDKHRKLFNVLTGTRIEKQSFWQHFKKASEKRNAIVHKGDHANKEEAEAALGAANAMIMYLEQI